MKAWKPRRVKFVVCRSASRCYWCNYLVQRGTAAAYYGDEGAHAHERCHREACA